MKKINWLVIVAAVIGLAGCYTGHPDRLVPDKSKVSYDAYTKLWTVEAQELNYGAIKGISTARLRGWFGKNTEAFQLYVHQEHHDWLYLDRAFDSEGTQLDVLPIQQKALTGYLIRECLGVNLTKDYLDRKKAMGLNIKVKGRNGEVIFEVPGHYVCGFMETFEKAKAGAP